MIKRVSTAQAPAAIGPYSQAVIAGKLIFTAGQISIDPKTNKVVGDSIKEQTERVIKNIQQILRAAGADLKDVIKTTVFLADMEDFAGMNDAYGKYFKAKPARSTVEVARLPKDVRIEIEAIALRH